MSEQISTNLSGVTETLLITLYIRALETQRPDALIKDEQSVALMKKISDVGLYDFRSMKSLRLGEENRLVIILRNREFDCLARDFLSRNPDAVVVHIGCGLDTRFERVDNGRVDWFDLDLPKVIELRRRLMGNPEGRRHMLGCSVHEDAWLDTVRSIMQRPFLFLAEGVFMYFTEEQVRRLVLRLRDKFPGSELVFDAYSPIHVWRHNIQYAFARIKFPTHWGIWHVQEIEGWAKPSTPLEADGIHLLGEWGYFDEQTPRLNRIRWMRRIETAARTMRIYHFRLG